MDQTSNLVDEIRRQEEEADRVLLDCNHQPIGHIPQALIPTDKKGNEEQLLPPSVRFEWVCRPIFERLQEESEKTSRVLDEIKTTVLQFTPTFEHLSKQVSKLIDGNGNPPLNVRLKGIEDKIAYMESKCEVEEQTKSKINQERRDMVRKILTQIITTVLIATGTGIIALVMFWLQHKYGIIPTH